MTHYLILFGKIYNQISSVGYSFHDVNEESIHIYLNQVYDLLSESMESFHPAARISAENIIEYIDIFIY